MYKRKCVCACACLCVCVCVCVCAPDGSVLAASYIIKTQHTSPQQRARQCSLIRGRRVCVFVCGSGREQGTALLNIYTPRYLLTHSLTHTHSHTHTHTHTHAHRSCKKG